MKNGFIPILVLTILVVVAALALISARLLIDGNEDSWICENGEWVAHGKPSQTKPSEPCEEGEIGGSPRDIVETFYNWYLGYDGNPLVTGAYKDRSELSSGFKVKVETILKSSEMGGFDPILQAQDIPQTIEVGTPVVEGDIARVQVDEDFGGNIQSLQVALIKENGEWLISDIEALNSLTPLSPNNQKYVVVYFANPTRSLGSTECGVVFGVERPVAKDASYKDVLDELFKGPTTAEKNDGYSSFFSNATEGSVKSVKVVGSTAYVDMKDLRNIIPNASSSCGSAEFFAQVGETLKHDRRITKVIYAIEGDPAVFYEWVQLGCSVENNNCDKTPFN